METVCLIQLVSWQFAVWHDHGPSSCALLSGCSWILSALFIMYRFHSPNNLLHKISLYHIINNVFFFFLNSKSVWFFSYTVITTYGYAWLCVFNACEHVLCPPFALNNYLSPVNTCFEKKTHAEPSTFPLELERPSHIHRSKRLTHNARCFQVTGQFKCSSLHIKATVHICWQSQSTVILTQDDSLLG